MSEVLRVSIHELEKASETLWSELATAGVMALTAHGEVVAVLSPASAETLSEMVRALRRARALAEVERIQQESRGEPARRLTLDEIAARIESVSATSGT